MGDILRGQFKLLIKGCADYTVLNLNMAAKSLVPRNISTDFHLSNILAFIFPQLAHFKLMAGRQQNAQLTKGSASGNPNPGNHEVGSSEHKCVKGKAHWNNPISLHAEKTHAVGWKRTDLPAELVGVHQLYEVHLETTADYAPQDLVLELIGFNFSTNDLDKWAECTLSKVADGTKLGAVADAPDGCATIQRGPGWAGEMDQRKPHEDQQSQMPSAAPGETQPHVPAQAGGDQLKSSIAEKDLRFLVSTLKMSQPRPLAAKTDSILGCTRKSITSLSREVILSQFPKFLAIT